MLGAEQVAVIALGTERAVYWRLTEDGEPVLPERVQRAQFRLPAEATEDGEPAPCWDTVTDTDEIWLEDDGRTVVVKLGGVALLPGTYRGYLTVFDLAAPDGGLPWAAPWVRVIPWEQCPD